MKSYLIVKKTDMATLPHEFITDGRFDPKLLHELITSYSKPGDNIFDPFCGFGTTIAVSEKLGRSGYGVEIDKRRFDFARSQVRYPERILQADISTVNNKMLPVMDLCITSPTYAWKNSGCNPFTLTAKSDYYNEYLKDIAFYFEKIEKFIKAEGLIIIDCANIQCEGVVTTLAWDIKKVLENVSNIHFLQETIICWEGSSEGYMGGKYGFGYDHSYCLFYRVTHIK